MSENNNLIVAKELTKVYNETTTAVDHLDLEIKEGEIFGRVITGGEICILLIYLYSLGAQQYLVYK